MFTGFSPLPRPPPARPFARVNPVRVARLLQAEAIVQPRAWVPWMGLGASALVAWVARQSLETMGRGELTLPAYLAGSLTMASTTVVPLFAVVFAAGSVAGETGRGTHRAMLSRPVSRAEWLTAKLLTAWTYVVMLFAANLTAAVWFGRRYAMAAAADRDLPIPDTLSQAGLLAAAVSLALLPHFATAAFGFLVSVVSGSAGTAIGVAVGTLLTLTPLKHVDGLGLEPWVVSTYYDTPFGIAADRGAGMYEAWDQPKVWWLLGVSAATAAVCLITAFGLFARRDLNE